MKNVSFQRATRNWNDAIPIRVIELAQYVIDTNDTVRGTAKEFHICKSTVHNDLTNRLPYLNHALFAEVRKVLDNNRAERHMRGGIATKLKYQNLKNCQ